MSIVQEARSIPATLDQLDKVAFDTTVRPLEMLSLRMIVLFTIQDNIDQFRDFMTIFRAKGKEADYVLLLGCVSGEFGFPSEIKEEKLMKL